MSATGHGGNTECPYSVLLLCVAALKPGISALGGQPERQSGKCNGLTFASLSSEPFSARQIFAGDIDIILKPQK